jgi:hypothetical protein
MEKRAPDPRDESNREDSIKYRRMQIENLQQRQVNTSNNAHLPLPTETVLSCS